MWEKWEGGREGKGGVRWGGERRNERKGNKIERERERERETS